MKQFHVTDEEAHGIIFFPEPGLYVLMRSPEGKVLGGELVEQEGKLPIQAAALPRYYPDDAELVVAHFDGTNFTPRPCAQR